MHMYVVVVVLMNTVIAMSSDERVTMSDDNRDVMMTVIAMRIECRHTFCSSHRLIRECEYQGGQ